MRERRALAAWNEKKLRTRDANRKRSTRAWYRRHWREPVSPQQRFSSGGRPDSTWMWKFIHLMLETQQLIESRDGFGFIPRDEAVALAGRVILMACLTTDPDAGGWTPRITKWQDLPWEGWHKGERLDRLLWSEGEVAPQIHETRRHLMGQMFHHRNAEAWVALVKKAMATWKRLAPVTANPLTGSFECASDEHVKDPELMSELSSAGLIMPETFRPIDAAVKENEAGLMIGGEANKAEFRKPAPEPRLDRVPLPVDNWKAKAPSPRSKPANHVIPALSDAATLAKRNNIPLPALFKRLERERKKRPDCAVELDDTERKSREAKYLYRTEAVQHIIDSLKASSSVERQST